MNSVSAASSSQTSKVRPTACRISFLRRFRYSILTLIPALLLFPRAAAVQSPVPQSSPNSPGQREPPKQNTLPTLSELTRELRGGETHSYRIDLKAGQFFYGLVEQQGIDVVVDLFDPTGQHFADADSPNDNWDAEPILFVADASGSYRVDISCTNKKAPAGRYAIKLMVVREATVNDKSHVAAESAFEQGRKLRAQGTAASRRAAIEKYEQAAPLFESAGDTYRQALTILSIGFAYAQLNEFRTALRYFDKTLSLAQQLNQRRLEAATHTFLGGANDVLGNFKEALNHYERAVTLAQASGNTAAAANALNNIGKIYNDSSNWQRALEFYSQALPLLKAIGNQRSEAQTINNIGVAYYMLGEPHKALGHLQDSLSLRRSTADKNGESLTLTNMGNTFAMSGDYEKAQECYRQARAIETETGNKAQEADTLDFIGAAYTAAGHPEEALRNHQQALAIHRTTGNVRREAVSLTNLGYVLNALGQPLQALQQLDQAVAIFRNIGDLNNVAIALERSASAERKLHNFQQARKKIEESLALVETVRARSASQQLRASYLASQEKAYEFYVDLLMQQEAQEPGKGHAAEALQASERGRARSLTEMLNEAQVDIQEGVNVDLVMRERDLRQSLNAKAQRQIQLTAQKASPQEIETLNKEISALEDEYQQVQVAIRKASPAYAALTQPQPLGLKEIQEQLDPNTVLLEYSLGDERSYLWSVTQNSLKTYELPKRAQIKKIAQQVYESLTARSVVKPLETLAQRQERIAQADRQFQQFAAELSGMVLAPAAAELGAKRLVVVADGPLQYVPFSSLSVVSGQSSAVSGRTDYKQRTDNGPLTTYRPLILDHEVVSLPSASALAVHRQTLADRKPAPRALAVIADPVFSTSDARLKANARTIQVREDTAERTSTADDTRMIEHLAENSTGQLTIRRLPFTRQEADQILAVAPAASNLKAMDFRANRAIAMSGELSKYRYVHFATHGYLDSERADLSAIVLSLVDDQGKSQDGFLRTLDIYNLKLPAELVVLSACETGLGKDVKGEGLVGLTRGFMYAGARRVVVSLWNVNDKATADLMAKFYEKMLKQKERPSAALRAAQVEMWKKKQWRSPYYWAAFTMQGEWR